MCCMEATGDLQKQLYNITLTAVVRSAKTECQVQSAALQSHATRWLCMYDITPLTCLTATLFIVER